jgi:hypothetical protein
VDLVDHDPHPELLGESGEAFELRPGVRHTRRVVRVAQRQGGRPPVGADRGERGFQGVEVESSGSTSTPSGGVTSRTVCAIPVITSAVWRTVSGSSDQCQASAAYDARASG